MASASCEKPGYRSTRLDVLMYIDDKPFLKQSALEDSDDFQADGRSLLRSVLRGAALIVSLCVLGGVLHWLSDNDIFGFRWLDRQIGTRE